mmetsp:Transcript_9535/g.13800  ORF Transcript_9535/g.13800 Transcript_9535/m.13800 type:complete len:242 (-) Transcript_9535:674-1399(-)
MNILSLIALIYGILSKPKERWELFTFWKEKLTDWWPYLVTLQSRVDMSLDDLIKVTRKEQSTTRRRQNPKVVKDAGDKKPTNVQKSIGQTKAKRDAAVNARRRDTPSNTKPTSMDVEKEVNRVQQNRTLQPPQQQQQRGGAATRGRRNRSGRGPVTLRRRRGPVTKAATLQFHRNQRGRGPVAAAASTTITTALQPPTRKAVSAAVRAMKEFGFQPPKGMDVVICFAPKPTITSGGRGGKS